MTRVAVLISGRGSNMEALLRAAAAGEIPRAEMAVVISNRADAAGLEIARALGVEALAIPSKGLPREAHERRLDEALQARHISLVCLAGYMRLLTGYFVGRWAGRMLNIHPSLLPAYPGLDTHARVLAAGEREHGCTVHLVTETMDEGPILGQARVPVLPGDTEAVLAARVLAAEHKLYPATLRAFLLANGPASPVKSV
jgi:formyltetrahydrofolate-dependent phosphoribosylglycinamide formyltransferase